MKVADFAVAYAGMRSLVLVVAFKTVVATALPLLLAVVLQWVGLYRYVFSPANTVKVLVGSLWGCVRSNPRGSV